MSFKRLDPQDFLISSDSVTTSAWSGNQPALASFFTSSVQKNSSAGDFYINVYDKDPSSDSTAEVQFTVGYGHRYGSGSALFTNSSLTDGKSPSSVVYGQMRTLLLGDEESAFEFVAGDNNRHTPDDIYVISLNRSRYKERIKPGSLELTVNNAITLKDNYSINSPVNFSDAGRVFEILENGTDGQPDSGSFGKIYPDVGIILINQDAIQAGSDVNNSNVGSDVSVKNAENLIDELSNFKLTSEETLSSNYIFIRARNSEFNYTTNPSYLTGSGEIRYQELINSPETYITTVGLYNDNQDLLAVAKLSRPLLKNSTKEALIRVKLDY